MQFLLSDFINIFLLILVRNLIYLFIQLDFVGIIFLFVISVIFGMYRYLMGRVGFMVLIMDDKIGRYRYLLESICNVDVVLYMNFGFDNGGGKKGERCSGSIGLLFFIV